MFYFFRGKRNGRHQHTGYIYMVQLISSEFASVIHAMVSCQRLEAFNFGNLNSFLNNFVQTPPLTLPSPSPPLFSLPPPSLLPAPTPSVSPSFLPWTSSYSLPSPFTTPLVSPLSPHSPHPHPSPCLHPVLLLQCQFFLTILNFLSQSYIYNHNYILWH